MSENMGRPKSKNPKIHDIKIRIDEETNIKLLKYAEKHGITRAEVIRRGLDMILSKDN